MKKIGVLYGRENTFPGALVAKINELGAGNFEAESVSIGAITMEQLYDYRVIIDRISQDVPFYRAVLKHAVMQGVNVINNPFWWTADDKFFNYALAHKIGVAIPKTALLPHKQHPPDINSQSLRNLLYPLNFDEIFEYIGFPAFLKPYSGGGWKHVYKVHSREEFFSAYDQTGDLCMTLQANVEFTDYFRCYVIGKKNIHIMRYDPRLPHERRYVLDGPPLDPAMQDRLTSDCLKICNALGYDMNTVEFAVQDGIPYAIDFLNPAPDADYHSVGPENFAWIVNAMAELAIEEAGKKVSKPKDYRWSKFL
ncbi:RimK family alpha-L-glutamate ligase [Armatimonas sp.]|uniref:ATP-grasp domain-containing protein n=1 Tax=Armatimonas sp. TaxID=1872638 RepID=UPI003751E32A